MPSISSEKYPSVMTAPFEHLPAFAQFILDTHLSAFSAASLAISRALEMPLLRYFESMPEEQLVALSMEGSRKLLTALAANKAEDYVADSLHNWRENQLPLIQSDDVVIEDISKGNFARRKAFRSFMPLYSGDPTTYIDVMEEVDRFTLLNEDASLKMLFEMKEGKIREHHHLIDKINNASPGIIYVYDLESGLQVYSNHKNDDVLGYQVVELTTMDGNAINSAIHPDDRPQMISHRKAFAIAADSELRMVEFRLKDKCGNYVWQRAYETVFKRNADGDPTEIIGISLDVTDEKESSIKLEHRELQLREAQEIAGMGSFEWNIQADGSILSDQLLRIFEMEERSNLSDFLQYVHPADRESVRKAIADSLNGISDYECEYRYRKHGPEKVIWSRGKVTFDNAGRPLRMKGTVMDVTQRHDMLKRLTRSEQLHKQAQALTQLGNWSWSLADDRVEWSDEMYRIFGLTPQSEEMTLGRILELVHPEDREGRRGALHHALVSRETDDYTMRVVTPDGVLKYVDGKSEVLSDEAGKPYKIVGTCQDISRQYLLNERLKENENASRQLINNAPEAIVVINQSSEILLWNPKAEAVFGWTLEEIQGKTLMDTIIPPAFRQAHFDGVNRLQTTGQIRVLNKTIEVEALKKSGAFFFVSLTISRSMRAGQAVYIAFIRDITEERATATKLDEQRAQLAQKNRALERSNQELTSFNYIASHDLKEPVRKIKLFSNIVATAGELPVRVSDSMNRIMASADHMERLIEALVLFSRTNTSDRTLESVDLAAVMAEMQSLLKDGIDELGASVIVEPLPVIQAMPFQTSQLFENLIGNALKYRKSDVSPVIRISAATVLGSEIADEPGADASLLYHKISVADNGIGFEKQFTKKVFEVFQRLHSKEVYSGTGIGLAICKKIVEQHEGFISAISEPGVGTTFDVYLPTRI